MRLVKVGAGIDSKNAIKVYIVANDFTNMVDHLRSGSIFTTIKEASNHLTKENYAIYEFSLSSARYNMSEVKKERKTLSTRVAAKRKKDQK